jgi:hypothetical protein
VTRERRRDPDFAKSVVDALEPAVQVIEDALFAADLRGDVRPQMFFLNNRTRNRRWEERWEHRDMIRYDRDEPIPMQAQVTAKGTEKGGVQRPRERLPTPYGRRTPRAPNFPALLRRLGASVLLRTYQAGKLVMVGAFDLGVAAPPRKVRTSGRKP